MTQPLIDEITIQIDGEDRAIKMSFGLKRLLVKQFDKIEDVFLLANDTDQSDLLVSMLLTTYLAGKPDKKVTPEDISEMIAIGVLSETDYFFMVEWASGHITDFFIQRLTTSAKTLGQMAERHPEEMKNMQQVAQSLQLDG
jgi:hypothetical protein